MALQRIFASTDAAGPHEAADVKYSRIGEAPNSLNFSRTDFTAQKQLNRSSIDHQILTTSIYRKNSNFCKNYFEIKKFSQNFGPSFGNIARTREPNLTTQYLTHYKLSIINRFSFNYSGDINLKVQKNIFHIIMTPLIVTIYILSILPSRLWEILPTSFILSQKYISLNSKCTNAKRARKKVRPNTYDNKNGESHYIVNINQKTRQRRKQKKTQGVINNKPQRFNQEPTPPTYVLVGESTNIHITSRRISFNLLKIYDDEECARIMIYKSFICNNYYIEELSANDDIMTVILRVKIENHQQMINILEKEGIEIISDEEVEEELSIDMFNYFNNLFNERITLLTNPKMDQILIYMWTPRRWRKTQNMIVEKRYNKTATMYITINNLGLSLEEDVNRDTILAHAKKALKNDDIIIIEQHENTNEFKVIVQEDSMVNAFRHLESLHIKFRSVDKFEITTDEEMDILTKLILYNKSISKSIKATAYSEDEGEYIVAYKITVNMKTNENIKKALYYEIRDYDILIDDIEQNTNGEEVTAKLISTIESMVKFEENFSCCITVSESYILTMEDILYIDNLYNEKAQLINEAENDVKAQTEKEKRTITKDNIDEWYDNCIISGDIEGSTKAIEDLKNTNISIDEEIDEKSPLKIVITKHNNECPKQEDYMDAIKNIVKLETTDYSFIIKETGEYCRSKVLIQCPFCSIKCDNEEWINNHITKFHKTDTLKKIGYWWTYIISNEDNRNKSIIDYLQPTECYKCSICGFTNTDKKVILKHLRNKHKKEELATLWHGYAGMFEDAHRYREERLRIKLFEPVKGTSLQKDIYYWTRGYKHAETQTQKFGLIAGARQSAVLINTDTNTREGKNYFNNEQANTFIKNIGINCIKIDKEKRMHLVGLSNTANSCYINALLQSLNNIEEFKHTIISSEEANDMIYTLRDLFLALSLEQNVNGSWVAEPHKTNIFQLLNVSPDVQEDCHEVFINMINSLNDQTKILFSNEEIKYIKNNENTTSTIAYNVDIIIEDETRTSSSNIYNVEELLEKQVFNEDEEVITKLDIKSNILCLNLARTSRDLSTKLMYRINIPKQLTVNEHTYTLNSAIAHRGNSADNGHYITYVNKGNKIYLIGDDNECKEICSDNISDYIFLDKEDERVSMLFYTLGTHKHKDISEHNSIFGKIEKWNRYLGILPLINFTNNNVEDQLSEVTSTEQYWNLICSIKEKHKNAWGIKPNLRFCKELDHINLITYGIIKGILPTVKDEKVCCFPNCNTVLSNTNKRTSHWNRCHKNHRLLNWNPIIEICEIMGADICTTAQDDVNDYYINHPLVQCPIQGCQFAAHHFDNLTEHISHSHKDAYEQVKPLSPLHKHIFLMLANKKKLTLNNMLYKGDGVRCNECGWLSSSTFGAAKHPAMNHRDKKTKDKIFMEKVHISHEVTERDGTCISPYIGLDVCKAKEYLICKQNKNDPQKYTKNMLIEKNLVTPLVGDNTEQCHIEIVNDVPVNECAFTDTQQNIEFLNENPGNLNAHGNNDKEKIEMSDEEISEGLKWHRMYFDRQDVLPKYKAKNRKSLQEAMKDAIKFRIIPILKTALEKDIPESYPSHEIINGYMCRCFVIISEAVKQALGIKSNTKGIPQSPKSLLTKNLEKSRRDKDIGDTLAKSIEEIDHIRKSCLAPGVQQNKEEEQIQRILDAANQLSKEFKITIFDRNEISRECVLKTIDSIISSKDYTNIMRYIEHANKEYEVLDKKQKEIQKNKTRDLFRLSPKTAMRYYINPTLAPNCSIPIDNIQEELRERWKETPFSSNDSTWETKYKLSQNDAEFFLKQMTSKELFTEVIKSRDIVSAHGTDGIGYWCLKVIPELGAEMMAMISKIIMKYQFIPSMWNSSKTILLYKKGNKMELKNWRPLNITSCLYRTWTCAVAQCIQKINRSSSKLFNDNQKGFIKGINGCLEHSAMITEVLADANRNRRNLYIMALDLKDAFGSLPHDYLMSMINQLNFPKEIKNPIFDAYKNAYSRVYLKDLVSDKIRISKGVMQGDPLSPLLFNMCMNPLLDQLDKKGIGYSINNSLNFVVQAYADDIILFSRSKEGMESNMNIVQQFLAYSKVQLNANKCKSMSYIFHDGSRFFDEVPFTINNESIPIATLDESIEYLGTSVATTHLIRKKGVQSAVEEFEKTIDNIDKSVLTLSQKVYAIRTFAIPCLDYVLSNGRITNKTTKLLDRKIRNVINRHVKGVHLPINVFYTHWKDGGLSLQQLEERALALRARNFIALYNSSSIKVKLAMKHFIESERKFRKIEIIEKQDIFLNWKLEGRMKSGTDTITIHALRTAIKKEFTITIDEENDKATANFKIDKSDNIPADIIGEDGNTVHITDPKEVVSYVLKDVREKHQNHLVHNKAIGHSFIDIKESPFANTCIANYKSELNDNIASFILKARCNMLPTGAMACKIGVPINQRPKCPYCGSIGGDTIAHRLNICKKSRVGQTIRHNNVQNIILHYLKKKLGMEYKMKTNSTIKIDNINLSDEYKNLKPDLVLWNHEKIIIIEFSIPYANISHNENKLAKTYKEKVEKYTALAKECKNTFKRDVKLYTIIVSSLGAIYSESIENIKELLQTAKYNNSTIKKALRRISIASCISSYFIFNKLKFKEFIINTDDNEKNDNEKQNESQCSCSDDEDQLLIPIEAADSFNITAKIDEEEDGNDAVEEEDDGSDAGEKDIVPKNKSDIEEEETGKEEEEITEEIEEEDGDEEEEKEEEGKEEGISEESSESEEYSEEKKDDEAELPQETDSKN